MAEVSFPVAGRTYRVGCADGEESHLLELAARLDSEASDLAERLGSITEARLLLMVALMTADRLSDAEKMLAETETRAAEALRRADEAAAALGGAKEEAETAKTALAEAEAKATETPEAAKAGGSADLFTSEQEAALANRITALAERLERLASGETPN